MANIQQLLAASLEQLRKLQEENPHIVLKGAEQLSRTHLNRLLAGGWISVDYSACQQEKRVHAGP